MPDIVLFDGCVPDVAFVGLVYGVVGEVHVLVVDVFVGGLLVGGCGETG